ncbi:hypothetical protein DH2020_024622 [Rehmannia glutinosa]|uniref:Uncharacterized protein n=1 Tax=Rehmannia glutinosa TaxID=99300 RepID=A0ABR0W6F5_REHGL
MEKGTLAENYEYVHVNYPEKNELSQWVEHVTKQLMTEDYLPETGTETETELSRNFQASPEFRPKKSARKNPDDGPGPIEPGLNLLTLLFECAVAISVDNLGEAHRMLLEITQMASPYGPSCAERVVAYFAKAMSSRVINSWIGFCSPLVNIKSLHSSFQVFNNVAPFVKFAHFTSNQAIMERSIDRTGSYNRSGYHAGCGGSAPRFHISTRPPGQARARAYDGPRELRGALAAESAFPKCGEIADLATLQVRRGETLAVHWLQHSLYDATGPDWKTMRVIQGLGPKVITLVEQEIAHGGSFLDRFVISLHYYSTLFDSLGAFLPGDDPGRHQVEHCLLHREINNVLAIGGPARSGEDKFRHWRSELLRNGFLQIPMSTNSMAQAQLILNMFPPVHGYNLVQGDGTLRLGWKDTSLYTLSLGLHKSFEIFIKCDNFASKPAR